MMFTILWLAGTRLKSMPKQNNICKTKQTNLLQDSGKHCIFVHIQVNTLYLTEDMQVLSNLIKNKWDNIQAFCKCTPILQWNQPASSYWYLQDHAARSFLSPVSPFPGQVPADEKARQQSSTQDQLRVWMIHKHYNTCMTRNHALMMNFYLQGMQALWYLCMSKHEEQSNVMYLMLHANPKFVHFCEILKNKLHSIYDSVSIPEKIKEAVRKQTIDPTWYKQTRNPILNSQKPVRPFKNYFE